MEKEKQLTPIMQVIEKTRADLKEIRILLEGKFTADEKSVFEGSAVAMEGFINRLTNSLPAEEKAMKNAFESGVSMVYDNDLPRIIGGNEKWFRENFKTVTP